MNPHQIYTHDALCRQEKDKNMPFVMNMVITAKLITQVEKKKVKT